MEALLNAMEAPDFPAVPVGVLSNNPAAVGLTKARERDVPVAAVNHKFYPDRHDFEHAVGSVLDSWAPDILCLAGFMRVLTGEFVEGWSGRMLNIHPSLLPKYPGLNTHQRALDAGDSVAGCTVHEVIADLDAGPILGQAQVPILPDDDAVSLARRILPLEHRLYPETLRRFASGQRDRFDLSA